MRVFGRGYKCAIARVCPIRVPFGLGSPGRAALRAAARMVQRDWLAEGGYQRKRGRSVSWKIIGRRALHRSSRMMKGRIFIHSSIFRIQAFLKWLFTRQATAFRPFKPGLSQLVLPLVSSQGSAGPTNTSWFHFPADTDETSSSLKSST